MAKKYYKVVGRDSITGNPTSCILDYTPLSREYGVTTWTRGFNETPVLAFSSLASAQMFVNCNAPTCEIWEAQVRRPRKITVLESWVATTDTMLLFWQAIEGKHWSKLSAKGGLMKVPPNTVACEAIKLVKKVV